MEHRSRIHVLARGSKPRSQKLTRKWRRCRGIRPVVVFGLWLLGVSDGGAGVYKTQKQALSEVFPNGFERKTAFLTDEQARAVEQQARSKLDSKIITYYVSRARGPNRKPAATAFFDTHTIRTMIETVLVLVSPEGRVVKVEILAFYEPEDYKVREGWLNRLSDKNLEEGLTVGRDLVRVTGATLTVRALAAAVRRALALHEVLGGDARR